MNSRFKLFSYYILLVLGLVSTSWIIWGRFLRERIIRDIPDGLFTEYRFWILFSISCIYFYTVKNYIKPKTPNIFLIKCAELFYIPLITLDHAIKYNVFFKPYYYNLMEKLLNYLYSFNRKEMDRLLYIFEILPRIILVFFLLLDSFYFNKLEIFYKVVLIGLFPFMWRYINYCFKDICNHWTAKLEFKYKSVLVFEKGREFQFSLQKEKPKYHGEEVSIKKYIELAVENKLDNYCEDNFPYKYTGIVFAKDEIYYDYYSEKYKNNTAELTEEDYKNIDQLFQDLMTKIIHLSVFLDDLSFIRDRNLIKRPKIVIFSLYFLCWSFILIVCYWCYPVKLEMLMFYLENLSIYLTMPDNIFSGDSGYSWNKNLVTINNLKRLLENLVKIIFL